MKSCSQGSPGRLGCKVGRQGRNGLCIVTGVVGELHRDGLRGALRDRSIEPPEMLSHSILLVMMFPQEANSLSRSGWVMCFGRPDTYRLAPLMASLLGRAKDTFIVLFCNLNPFRVWIALEASSCL